MLILNYESMEHEKHIVYNEFLINELFYTHYLGVNTAFKISSVAGFDYKIGIFLFKNNSNYLN